MGKLQWIKSTAQNVTSAMAAALGVDVALIDTDYNLVATSKTFIEQRGTEINKVFVQNIIEQGPAVISNPGFHKWCKGCRNEGNCPETAEVLRPINYEGEVIGVILLVTFTQIQKEKLLSNTATLVEFIDRISDLICSKIKEKEIFEHEKIVKQQLETTINFVDKGIITINNKGVITQINEKASRILNQEKSNLLGLHLGDFIPYKDIKDILKKGRVIRGREVISNESSKVHCVLSGTQVKVSGEPGGAVICLEDIDEFRSFVYEFSEKNIDYTFDDIQGNSDVMEELKEYAKKIAKNDSTVLIQGESGTGKELFARAIHSHSNRSRQPFIPVNCAAIPESLLESEMFGYEAGAFTGAKKSGKPGKFEMANGGSIFLDEISEMPLHLQAKLLRVLQEKTVERVGGVRSIPVDVRIIAATNQDLETMVKNNKFREDLFYRLDVIPLHITPLRNRKSDILVLANFFLNKYSKKFSKNINGFSKEVKEILLAYRWPGNVRELENIIEYAVNVNNDKLIVEEGLPERFTSKKTEEGLLARRLQDYEKLIIEEALESYSGSVEGKKSAAKQLGISLPTLYRKMKDLNL